MKNPFKRDPPAEVQAAPPAEVQAAPPAEVQAAPQKETPAPPKEYPGLDLEVCRQRIERGVPKSDVIAWLLSNYPGFFKEYAEAEAALERPDTSI